MIPSVEFWSSVECAAFQKGLLRELRAAGCAAEERFAIAEHAYRDARTPWARLRMRARAYGSYPLHLWTRSAPAPRAIRVVCSNTFYAPWLAMRSSRGRDRRVVHWVFDLFPDVLLAGGWRDLAGVGEACLRRVMRQTFDRAAANVFLGTRLLEHAERKFGPIPRACVIPIGADGAPFRATEPAPRPGPARPLSALYCGNLGRMHDTATLLAALPGLADGTWHVRFHGHGTGYAQLRARLAAHPTVHFDRNLPDAEWAQVMAASDLALVTLQESAAGLVLPSKVYSAFVAGQAVLAVCPPASDLAEIVRRHDAGWVVAPGDAAGLVALVRALARDPAEVLRKRRNAWHAGHTWYEQRVIAAQWRRLLEVVEAQARS